MASQPGPTTLHAIAPDAVHDEYERRGIAAWSDQRLVATAVDVVARPKVAPADSFVLHAPLELLARAGLLPYVAPAERDAARRRIAWLAATYEAAGEASPDPAPVSFASVGAGVETLAASITAGDLDAVDRAADWLGAHASPASLRRLVAPAVAPSLAAAGHASIFFFLHGRVAPRADVTGRLLRGPARELARHPDWSLHWYEDDVDATAAHDGTLLDALLSVPMLGVPGSDFIYPLMSQVQDNGLAAKLLAPVLGTPVADALRTVQRVAAWSMLQEPGDYAPYGWSHCLTMPQAVMGLAGEAIPERDAVAIAATYVVGFRAALGARAIEPYEPVPRCDPAEISETVTRLATSASRHHDAHLVKYTRACLDAAAFDPDGRDLYLDAAEHLAQWWAAQPGDGFFD